MWCDIEDISSMRPEVNDSKDYFKFDDHEDIDEIDDDLADIYGRDLDYCPRECSFGGIAERGSQLERRKWDSDTHENGGYRIVRIDSTGSEDVRTELSLGRSHKATKTSERRLGRAR